MMIEILLKFKTILKKIYIQSPKLIKGCYIKSTEKYELLNVNDIIYFLRQNTYLNDKDLDNFLSKTEKVSPGFIEILNRKDVDQFDRKNLDIVDLPYNFLTLPPAHIYGDWRPFLGTNSSICASNGGRNLVLQNAVVTAGWDIIRCEEFAVMPQLSVQNELLLESYSLDNKILGWTKTKLIIQKDRMAQKKRYDKAIVIFGSYMEKWGHVSFDLLLRLMSIREKDINTLVIVEEDTPKNFVDLIRLLWGFRLIEYIPKGESILVDELIFPLERTFNPVGWKDDIDVDKFGWSWVVDGPAWRELKQLCQKRSMTLIGKTKRKIYLKRLQRNVEIINRNDVEDLLQIYGFEYIVIEQFSLKDIITIMGSAECIVASSGSHVTNLLFAPDGIPVILLGPDTSTPVGAINLLSYLNFDLRFIACEQINTKTDGNQSFYEKKQQPILVPIQLLAQSLSDL